MESPPSPKPDLALLPDQQQQKQQQQQNHHQQGPQSPVSKRRKVEHRVVITVRVDDSSGNHHKPDSPPSDFWSWRKYGQKPIKGSPYPRGYYRCSTSKGCSAKKQVERCRTDASLIIITYTSTHNHEGPDLHQITSSQGAVSAATEEHQTVDRVEGDEEPHVPQPESPDSGHSHRCTAGANINQTSPCSPSAAEEGVSDNGNSTEVAVPDHPSLNGGGGHHVHADAGPELHQLGCSVAEPEGGKLLEASNMDESHHTPPDSTHDREGQHLHQTTCSAVPAQDSLLISSNGGDEALLGTSSTKNVSAGCDAEAKVPEILNSKEAPCSKQHYTEAPPTCKDEVEVEEPSCVKEEEEEEPRPPSPPNHSPEGKLDTSDKATDSESNHTLQPEPLPFDQGSVGTSSSTQTGLSSDEFDFYDELDELPAISPWTSILMGSFFDERILLPS